MAVGRVGLKLVSDSFAVLVGHVKFFRSVLVIHNPNPIAVHVTNDWVHKCPVYPLVS